MPQDRWQKLAELMGSIEPDLARRIERVQAHLPDPVNQPVSTALVKAYLARLQIFLDSIRGGAEGAKHEYEAHPNLMREIQELESWLLRKTMQARGSEGLAQHKDELGNWLTSVMGYSYTKTRTMLDSIGRSKPGAPTKRKETLKMMDARIANQWSYPELAAKMCDCGATTHDEYCSERIRKRLKELESFLIKYGIKIPATTPEKNQD
jgi:hypothetical protein